MSIIAMDRKSGRIFFRCLKKEVDAAAEAILASLPKAEPYTFDEKDMADTFTISELVKIYNANRPEGTKALKGFSTKGTGIKRIEQILPDIPKFDGGGEKVSEETEDQGAPQKSSKIPNDATIRVLAEENPRRKGTKAHERFELFKDGMTVKEYLDAGGTRLAIRTNVEKGHIELEGD